MKLIGETQFDLTNLFSYAKQFSGENYKKISGNNFNILLDYNDNFNRHLHCSFVTILTNSVLIKLLENYDFNVITIEKSDEHRLIIITGTIEEWFNAINKNGACSDLMEQAYVQLRDILSLGHLWNNFTKTRDVKGNLTFIEKK